MRLQHVNVLVAPGETDRVVGFYTEALGLRRVDKPPRTGPGGAWLDAGTQTQVHISEREGQPHPDQHFGLVVDDFPAVLARLTAAGASWTEQEDVFGGRRGFSRDPAGNRVELLERSGELA